MISTGSIMIDKFFEGGLPSGSVNLVYGEPETGKTTIAIQCAVSCALQGYKTLYVDCDSTFAVQRLTQLSSGSFEEISERIILIRPKNFREQAMVIDQLMEYAGKSFGLMVFDTVTSLYRLKVSESPAKTFELNRELNRQLAILAQHARTQKIAALILSQVRTAFNEATISIEPVATRVSKFWADTIIELKPTRNPRLIRAVLQKNQKTARPVTCNLKIDETGIHDYPIR